MQGRVIAAVALALWVLALMRVPPAAAQDPIDPPRAVPPRPAPRPAPDQRDTDRRDADAPADRRDTAQPRRDGEPGAGGAAATDGAAGAGEPDAPELAVTAAPIVPSLDVTTESDAVIDLVASGGRLFSAIAIEVPPDKEVSLSVTAGAIAGEQDTIIISPREDRPNAPDATTADGQRHITLPAGRDSRRRVWLSAETIKRAATYRATLTVQVEGYARRYQLSIVSDKPNPPLGLRATHVVREPTGTLSRQTFRDCVAVDVRTETPPVVVIQRDPSSDPKALIPTGSQVHAYFQAPRQNDGLTLMGDDFNCPEGVVIEVGPLSPGSYAAQLMINSEPLAVRYDVRRPRLLAFLLVLAGGLLAFGARAFSRYQRSMASNEQAINEARRQLAGRRYDVRWDEISANNILRKARGSNRAWFGDDVPVILRELDAIPKQRDALRAAVDAFETTSLPREVSAEVEAAINTVRNTSTSAHAEQLPERIAALSAMCENGFREPLLDWLQAQQRLLVGHAEEIRSVLAQPTTDAPNKRVGDALKSLDQALKDAWQLVSTSAESTQLDKNHLFMLELVVPTAERMLRWLRDPDSDALGEPDWVSIRHLWLPEPEPEPPQSLVIPGHPRVVLLGDAPATSLQPLTFKVEGLEMPPDVTVRVEWQVAGDEVEAGLEATFVLADKASAGKGVSAQVTASRAGTMPFFTPVLWFEQQVESLTTKSRRQQQVAWVADTMFSIVGVLLAAGVASAVAWDNQFADLADYALLFSTGLGVDLGLGSGLATSLVDNITGRLRAPPPEEEMMPE